MTGPLKFKKPVIAVVGSAGKTTTKEMLASILSTRWKIFKSYGNANAPRHIAKYASRIKPFHKAVILEYGMSRHGEIRRSCKTIQPNIGIITNVGTAHIGNFGGSIIGIANTKSDLIRYMKPNGVLFLNVDDKNSKLLDIKNFKGKIFTVGQINQANYKASDVRFVNGGMEFTMKLNEEKHKFFIPIYGKHNIYNALFAIGVAHYLGFNPKDIQDGLRKYRKPRRRLTVYRLGKSIIIIDDTFSANPNAVKAALDVMSYIGKGRKIAVLGTMLEMGKYQIKGHRDVGKYLAEKQIDYLYTFGKGGAIIGQGAIEAGFPKERVKNFLSHDKLANYLIKNIKPNTTILFKASHGIHLNRVVRALLEYKKGH
ncbi:Mur ligase [Vulcanibacillus modesticaldus]|uniref:Mur ligase n=1 Tax=Vulcanibacillus modesticaldus TaxID=337097 RepID=A0A1D2YUG3_9BACI|nr:UDP-N-acetylmuramoyl-tripeptide--D-alanyl-D-alanine ligase [Vulcanibacillus modesticaldus]OEF99344.1 Mur ligase [Vulcanibacillus modesticaldus]